MKKNKVKDVNVKEIEKNEEVEEVETEEVEAEEIETEEVEYAEEDKEVTIMDMLNRIVVCLIIIAVILAINTVVLICKPAGTTEKKETTTTTENNNSGEESQAANYDVSMMNEVSVEEATKLFSDKKKTYVLYIGRPDCGACVSYLPTLQQAQADYGYVTQYLNINNIDWSSSEYHAFAKKLSLKYEMNYNGEKTSDTFGNWMGYTPMTVIIKDGKQVDGEIGAIDMSTLSKMLEKNGIKK